MKSGTAVIVVGDIEPELREGKDGKTYLNMIVKANSIEFPRNGKKEDNTNTSTTKPNPTEKVTEDIPDDQILCTSEASSIEDSTVTTATDNDDDDLPF